MVNSHNKKIINTSDKVILPHSYKFENTREAAKFNKTILKKARYSFTRALRREKGTIMEPGSEIRSINKLQPLLNDHEHWEDMRQIMSTGVTYKLSNLPEEEMVGDLTHMMKRGNHKSASDPDNEPTLLKTIGRKWIMAGCFRSQWNACLKYPGRV